MLFRSTTLFLYDSRCCCFFFLQFNYINHCTCVVKKRKFLARNEYVNEMPETKISKVRVHTICTVGSKLNRKCAVSGTQIDLVNPTVDGHDKSQKNISKSLILISKKLQINNSQVWKGIMSIFSAPMITVQVIHQKVKYPSHEFLYLFRELDNTADCMFDNNCGYFDIFRLAVQTSFSIYICP